jgi:hypothetical protein
MSKAKTYMQECYDLAVLFLRDDPELDTEENRDELAAHFQSEGESHIEYLFRPKAAAHNHTGTGIAMSDIIAQLGEVGEWISDKEWHQHPVASEAQRAIKRLRSNHKDVVKIKRRTDARLKAALAGLQQIYTVCKDNAPESCDARMALAFVCEVAGDAFEKATHHLTRGEQR